MLSNIRFVLNGNEGGGGTPLLFLSNFLRSSLNSFCLALTLFLIIVTQNNIPPLQKPVLKLGSFLGAGWDGRFLFGYRQCVADIFWLKAVQIIGEKTISKEQYDTLYQMVDQVTTLDPLFIDAYVMGGVIFAFRGNMPERSNALLHKGHQANPKNWEILFYTGFNDYFYFQNYLSAADNISKAALLPGANPLIARLASRLYVASGNPDTAIAFLTGMIQTINDDAVKQALLQRVYDIQNGKIKGLFRPPDR